MPLVIAAKNRILSMEMASSLKMALFQSHIRDITFHTHLSKDIMPKPLPKCQMSLITLQKICAILVSFPCHSNSQMKYTRCSIHIIRQIFFPMMACSQQPTPKPKFSHDGHFTWIIRVNEKTKECQAYDKKKKYN